MFSGKFVQEINSPKVHNVGTIWSAKKSVEKYFVPVSEQQGCASVSRDTGTI
jgi:hypothetical protein